MVRVDKYLTGLSVFVYTYDYRCKRARNLYTAQQYIILCIPPRKQCKFQMMTKFLKRCAERRSVSLRARGCPPFVSGLVQDFRSRM